MFDLTIDKECQQLLLNTQEIIFDINQTKISVVTLN